MPQEGEGRTPLPHVCRLAQHHNGQREGTRAMEARVSWFEGENGVWHKHAGKHMHSPYQYLRINSPVPPRVLSLHTGQTWKRALSGRGEGSRGYSRIPLREATVISAQIDLIPDT